MTRFNPCVPIVVGDLHGHFARIAALDRMLPPGVPLLQVGDFGWYPWNVARWMTVAAALDHDVFVVDGNHECHDDLPHDAEGPVQLATRLWFVPRGTVLEWGGLRIGCLGGAASIDRAKRTEGVDWFAAENLRERDIARAAAWSAIDLMVTHTPPEWLIQRHITVRDRLAQGLPVDFVDPNAAMVERLWYQHGCPPLISGHLHRHITECGVWSLTIDEAVDTARVLRWARGKRARRELDVLTRDLAAKWPDVTPIPRLPRSQRRLD
jgi:hypothetical protein